MGLNSEQKKSGISFDVLELDRTAATEEIVTSIQSVVLKKFRKRGAVVGISGGIDSSVVAALCVRALGPEKVHLLLMPEGESASTDESTELGRSLAKSLGVEPQLEDITSVLQGAGCYERRDSAIREVIPEYGPGWKSKIVLPSVIQSDQFRIFSVVAHSPEGQEIKARLKPEGYLGVVAATNFKQRTRKMMEYFHADRLNFAVAGTPNLLEYDQGFFVKGGDGLADFKPIAHLYKSQVYQLAEHLGVPEEICSRPPTTDTYSLPQSQEEFYFSLPYDQMDLCLWAKNHGVDAQETGAALGLSAEQVERVYRDIEAKRRMAVYLHAQPAFSGRPDGATS
ncbi:MAG: NAD(+) synthase [Myxococcota bacterium]|nr:NAD(+) synthase [Spirochaeta sp.]RPG09306.1 MAG: NAD(+) synthase [Proteobacteria bacterium TMED72]